MRILDRERFWATFFVSRKGTARLVLENIAADSGRLRTGSRERANSFGCSGQLGRKIPISTRTIEERKTTTGWRWTQSKCELFSSPNSLLTGKNTGNCAPSLGTVRQ